ncbi:dnaJ homolog subfamily C member 1 [Paramuricea clavata]|uniref:DnaJ homolog subfamily C member 1 n=1 Tax=Paramuricea clavata TaxID=317549 RepID=A0A7D9E2A3_PARCT|nr:dnaJ homolog subfamily C member 1 [Paramuricea clavata]
MASSVESACAPQVNNMNYIQRMIDINASNLDGLRTQCTTSSDLIQQEIRDQEAKLVKLFSRMLEARQQIEAQCTSYFDYHQYPRLEQWLNVVGIASCGVKAIVERYGSFGSLLAAPENQVRDVLENSEANSVEDAWKLVSALSHLRRFTERRKEGRNDRLNDSKTNSNIYSWSYGKENHVQHNSTSSSSQSSIANTDDTPSTPGSDLGVEQANSPRRSPKPEIMKRSKSEDLEVLKDEEKRKRYDIILRDGLPDWRQPVFYYRRVRKMGFLEFLIFIFVIFTVGHFIIAWSVYLERKFELDDVLTSFKKKKEKRNRKLIKQGAVVDEVQVEDILDVEGVHKPTFWDLLPFVLYRLIVSTIRQARMRREYERQQKIRQQLMEEEEKREREKELENLLKPKPRRQRVQQPGVSSEDVAKWEGAPVTTHLARDDDLTRATEVENGMTPGQKEGEWNEEDLSKLSRLMVKYPGGTPGRWEKVACDMGRSVKDITMQVKQTKSMIKDQAVPHQADLTRLVPNKKTTSLDDNIVTQAVREDNNGMSNDHQVKPTTNGVSKQKSEIPEKGYSTTSAARSSTAESSEDDRNAWSQNQQKLFEKALSLVPKDAPDRWTQIARNVPGKTKDECVARYKFLVEMLKKRKRGETK